MDKIRFMTDSASDISGDEARELGIFIIPFPVSFGDKTYLSGVDLDNEQFYAMLEASEIIPTTSQITVFEYTEYYEAAWREGYTHLINTTINSEGSGTYNSACLARDLFYENHPEARNAFTLCVLDGSTYTCGYGYAVIAGARLAAEGKPYAEVVAFMQDWIANNMIFFAPYTLKYAAKSGRIPQAAAFVGELVGLKAIMRIWDHVITTDEKIRGEKKIMPAIRNKVLEEIADGGEYLVIYGNNPDEADAFEALLIEAIGYAPAGRSQVGAAVATNAGPDLIGVCFRKK